MSHAFIKEYHRQRRIFLVCTVDEVICTFAMVVKASLSRISQRSLGLDYIPAGFRVTEFGKRFNEEEEINTILGKMPGRRHGHIRYHPTPPKAIRRIYDEQNFEGMEEHDP